MCSYSPSALHADGREGSTLLQGKKYEHTRLSMHMKLLVYLGVVCIILHSSITQRGSSWLLTLAHVLSRCPGCCLEYAIYPGIQATQASPRGNLL